MTATGLIPSQSSAPTGPGNLRRIQNIQLQLARDHLHYRMRYHPSFKNPAYPALISWHDMIKLKMIPETFLVTSFFSTSIMMDLQTSVLQQHQDVFRESITATPMSGGKVHIHLQPNAVLSLHGKANTLAIY